MERFQQVTQAYSQAPWRRQMQLVGLVATFLVLAAVVAWIYLNVTTRASEVGRDIQRMQRGIDRIKRENNDLQSKLAYLTTAELMRKRALELGFQPVDPAQLSYITAPGYLGRQPAVLAASGSQQLPSPQIISPQFTESIWEWLRRQTEQSVFPFGLELP